VLHDTYATWDPGAKSKRPFVNVSSRFGGIPEMIFIAKNEDNIPTWKLVIDKSKTVTRRLKPMQIGKEFAVCPGRGKHAVCRAVVTDCVLSRVHYHAREIDLVDYKHLEAKMEGFKSWDGLMSWFIKHKVNFEDTFRIEFKVIKSK